MNFSTRELADWDHRYVGRSFTQIQDGSPASAHGLGVAMKVCYRWRMTRDLRVFKSLADADRAEEEYYASLTPSERVEILLDLIQQYRTSVGETAERFERVCRIAQLSEG